MVHYTLCQPHTQWNTAYHHADVSIVVDNVFVADITLHVLRWKFFSYVNMKEWEEEIQLHLEIQRQLWFIKHGCQKQIRCD